jgi:hypothetical protein
MTIWYFICNAGTNIVLPFGIFLQFCYIFPFLFVGNPDWYLKSRQDQHCCIVTQAPYFSPKKYRARFLLASDLYRPLKPLTFQGFYLTFDCTNQTVLTKAAFRK